MNILENFFNTSHLGQLFDIDFDAFSSLHFHLSFKDRAGKYAECNPQFLPDTGFSNKSELMGMTDHDFSFLTTREADMLRQHDKDVVKSDKTTFFVEPCTLHGDRKVIAYSYKMPIRIRSKKIVGSVAFSLIAKRDEVSIGTMLIQRERNDIELSRRQFDCLKYLVMGMTIKQVAIHLNLSSRTVEHYIEIAKQKLNCQNRAELISKALMIPEIQNSIIQRN